MTRSLRVDSLLRKRKQYNGQTQRINSLNIWGLMLISNSHWTFHCCPGQDWWSCLLACTWCNKFATNSMIFYNNVDDTTMLPREANDDSWEPTIWGCCRSQYAAVDGGSWKHLSIYVNIFFLKDSFWIGMLHLRGSILSSSQPWKLSSLRGLDRSP